MSFDLQAAGCLLDSFDAGTINLIVEGRQYKVNSFFLKRDSPVLREMFLAPREELPDTEPAWTLSGVTKEELEHLLWIYHNPSIEHHWAPIAVWRDILKLADMWQMTPVMHVALNHLRRAKLDPIEKIKLFERNDIGRYEARDAYIQVCTREEPLTPAEFQTLGMDPVLLIMQIRERILANRQTRERQEPLREEDIVDNAIGRDERPQMPGDPYDGGYC